MAKSRKRARLVQEYMALVLEYSQVYFKKDLPIYTFAYGFFGGAVERNTTNADWEESIRVVRLGIERCKEEQRQAA